MQLIPEKESTTQLTELAKNNLEESGVKYEEPNRIVFGYTPRGRACVDETADTVFMGPRMGAVEEKKEQIIDLEHEIIHNTQFNLLFGSTPQGYHEVREEIEERALEQSIEIFEQRSYIEKVLSDEHVHRGNLPLMLTLASKDEDFIEPLREIYREIEGDDDSRASDPLPSEKELSVPAYGRLGAKEERNTLKETEFVREAESFVKSHWQEILASDATDFAQPVVERYSPENDFRDDILEAPAQFWSLFRLQALEDIAEYEAKIYPEDLEEALEGIHDAYKDVKWYSDGENVRTELEKRIEKYRNLVSDNEEPYEAAAHVVNKDYEKLVG